MLSFRCRCFCVAPAALSALLRGGGHGAPSNDFSAVLYNVRSRLVPNCPCVDGACGVFWLPGVFWCVGRSTGR
jgi:hypothetical protein